MKTLVAYDIADDKKRTDFQKYLEKNDPEYELESFYEFKEIDYKDLLLHAKAASARNGTVLIYRIEIKTTTPMGVEFNDGERSSIY